MVVMLSIFSASSSEIPRSLINVGKRIRKLPHSVKGTGTGPFGELWAVTRNIVRLVMSSVKGSILTSSKPRAGMASGSSERILSAFVVFLCCSGSGLDGMNTGFSEVGGTRLGERALL